MIRTSRLCALVGGAMLVLGSGAAGAQDVRLMTGPQGGSWYPLGGAIKNLVEKTLPGANLSVGPGAGIANVKAIESNKADIAFANSVSTVDAINGKPPFEKAYTNVCNLATLYPQYFQIIALADAGINSPADLKGKALTTQQKGNTGEQITAHLLQAYGLSYSDLPSVSNGSYTDSVNLLKDGNAQWFTLGSTAPASSVMDLAAARDIKVVEVPEEGMKKMQEINPGYQPIVVKAGTYPKQDKDVTTVGYATHIVARCDLDDKTTEGILKALVDGVSDMAAVADAIKGVDAKAMAQDIGVPLHKAAEKFYKANGAL